MFSGFRRSLINPMNEYLFRLLGQEDQEIIWDMLRLATYESSVTSVQENPSLARYAHHWGRSGDLGWVAIASKTQHPLGAAWMRLWPENDRGFGYIADSIPELAIAVIPQYRRQGIGTQLLQRLLATAQLHYASISLNVRSDNPALHLYHRLGFTQVDNSKHPNRTGGQSFTMICRLSPNSRP